MAPLLFVTYKTSPLSNHGKLSFNFSAKICHVYYIVSTLLSTLLSKDKNVKLKRVVIFDKRYTTCSCLLYTSPSPRDQRGSRMPSSA